MLDLAWPLARPLLFRLDPEDAHERTLAALQRAPRLAGRLARTTMGAPDPRLAREAFGVRLAGPVGLAAGLDKDGRAIPFWPSLGFGFVEVGTVTAHPQPGNPRPRLFRLVEDRALVNRMGFNNDGSEALARRIRALREDGGWPDRVPVGANVGKSRITPLEDAPGDYVTSIERLRGLVDWFTINVSSPNTPGLRELQHADALRRLLGAVLEAADAPVLLKLAPDLADEALEESVELAISAGVAGIVATNTTLSRDGLSRDPGESGGLSGAPLWPLSRRVIGRVLEVAAGRVPVIGVGGISTADQVEELLEAGCVAVQLYTALIYGGPGLPARIHGDLARRTSAPGKRSGSP